MNVSEYLLMRLHELGVKHAFGVPGDFVLPFFETLAKSDITHIAACNELNVGYAADGYARIRGIGLAVVTYGPGAFSLLNAIAGAHAEDVPMVVVSGGPATGAYQGKPRPVLHHLLNDNYEASIKIFEQCSGYATVLDEPERVVAEIDKALSICIAQKKPVFLEIPKDIQLLPIEIPVEKSTSIEVLAINDTTRMAAELLVDRIKKSKRTVILPGHEIHRWCLQEKMISLLEKTNIPVASMFVGKAEYLEFLPNCIGAYQGAGSVEEVKNYVEGADTVIYLGCVPSDLNLGGFTAKLSKQQTVTIWNNSIEMDQGDFKDVSITGIVDALAKNLPDSLFDDENAPVQNFAHKPDTNYEVKHDEVLTSKRFYDRLANFFEPGDIVLGDASCAFNLTHMQFPSETTFIASNYWASIGMGFGATLGACFAGEPAQRIIAVEGDGSFQMTAQELSSMIRYKKSPIVFVVNNNGYTAERFIHDGEFNDIPQWQYHRLPEVFGGGVGIEVRTEGEFEMALEIASNSDNSDLTLIEVHLDPYDVSDRFRAMCAAFRTH